VESPEEVRMSVDLSWRRSTYCSNGACVEVAAVDGGVHARDGKVRSGPTLSFSAGAWQEFTTGVKRGQFGRPAA
jgi:hypothetical protein